ncbi:transferase [Streptomyces anulatus]|uniref:transferase n=1 Tax=Streptomyces anulatus TaxID=1892 RepID=UPI00341459A2
MKPLLLGDYVTAPAYGQLAATPYGRLHTYDLADFLARWPELHQEALALLGDDRIHPTAYVHPQAIVGDDVIIGPDVKVHEFSTVRKGSVLCAGASVGFNCEVTSAFVGEGAVLGHRIGINRTIVGNRAHLSAEVSAPRSLSGDRAPVDSSAPVTGDRSQPNEAADLPGQPDTERPVTGRSDDTTSVTGDQDSQMPVTPSVTAPSVTDRRARTAGDRRSDQDTEELLKIARSAVRAEGKLTRKVVGQAIRDQQMTLSSDTLTTLMAQLRKQNGQPVSSART